MRFHFGTQFTTTLGLTLTLFSVVSAYAAEPLSLDEAVQRAIDNNVQVRAIRSQLGVAEARKITAKAISNPTIISDNGVAEHSYRFGIQKSFETGGQRGKRVALAEAQRLQLEADIQTQFLEIENGVKKAYIDLYRAQQLDNSYAAIVEKTQHLYSIAKTRYNAGSIPELDVIQSRLVYTNSLNDQENQDLQILTAKNRLNALMGLDYETDFELAVPVIHSANIPDEVEITDEDRNKPVNPDLPRLRTYLPDLVKLAMANRPELKSKTRELATAEHELSLAQAERAPDVSVFAGPDKTTGAGGTLNAFLLMSVDLPVFNRQQGPIAEARAHYSQAQLEDQVLKKRIVLEVTNAFESVIANKARVLRYYRDILPDTAEVVSLSQKSYAYGKSTISVPIIASQTYASTQQSYINALYDYTNALNDLERALGF